MLRTLILSALLAAAGTAAASEIFLFEQENYRGRQFPAAVSMSNLDDANFNGRASSARITSGQWQLCTDAFFRGRCVALGPGDYPTLSSMGLGGGVLSVRDLWDYESGGARGGDIVLYDSPNFGGSPYRARDVVRNLDGTGFNDRAQSMIVYGGTWELCDDADFGGYCQTFAPGRYASLGRLNGRVSSLQPMGGAGGGFAAGGRWGSGNRAILYEGPNLTGQRLVVDRYIANLDGTGFNDRAQSLRIERGYWMFCSDAGFQGDCRTFGPGDYPQLPRGLNNRISSGRRISDDYPYKSNPNWGGQ